MSFRVSISKQHLQYKTRKVGRYALKDGTRKSCKVEKVVTVGKLEGTKTRWKVAKKL